MSNFADTAVLVVHKLTNNLLQFYFLTADNLVSVSYSQHWRSDRTVAKIFNISTIHKPRHCDLQRADLLLAQLAFRAATNKRHGLVVPTVSDV
jgi:hypothetical protein